MSEVHLTASEACEAILTSVGNDASRFVDKSGASAHRKRLAAAMAEHCRNGANVNLADVLCYEMWPKLQQRFPNADGKGIKLPNGRVIHSAFSMNSQLHDVCAALLDDSSPRPRPLPSSSSPRPASRPTALPKGKASTTQPRSAIAQMNAIKDPVARARFRAKNMQAIQKEFDRRK